MKSLLAGLIPHDIRQMIKRRLFVVRDMHNRLRNLKRAGFHPSGAIDGGAYRGDWTREFWSVWPHVPCALIEPLQAQQTALTALAQRVSGSFVVPMALSDGAGARHFALGETNSSLVSDAAPGLTVSVECTTLLDLATACPDFRPNFLKLDLQGHELAALTGAGGRMRDFEVVLLEVSVIRIGDVPVFSEVDRFMASRGFRLYDVIPQYYRPLDGALWQMDVFFVRDDSALVSSRAWA